MDKQASQAKNQQAVVKVAQEASPAAQACCAPSHQAVCCEPAQKSSCCGTASSGSCGCK